MPTLIVLGKEVTKSNINEVAKELANNGITLNVVDIDKFEIELIKNDDLGLSVTTHYKDGDNVFSGEILRDNNVTEVHFNYRGETYAIESDIHSTGKCPYKGNDIVDKIVVILETKKHEYF